MTHHGRDTTGHVADHPARRPVVVLVHGAWHGGWAWDEVARQLRSRGYAVEAPDLPGSDGQPGYGLTDQVTALLTVLGRHPRVVLVAHSFGGIVARQAAATLPAGQAHLVLVDGWVVENGRSFFDVMPEAMKERCAAAAVGAGSHKLIPAPPPAAFGVPTGPLASWLQSRLTPQPWTTFSEPSELDDAAAARAVPGHAVVCEPSALPFRAMAEDLGYPVSTLRSGHDAMVLDPAALTDRLLAPIGAV